MRFILSTSLSLLTLFAKTSALGLNNCDGTDGILGAASLDRYDYSIDMDIDKDNCAYSLDFTFQHDETLPIPDDPAVQCDPSIVPPALAPDGAPYFAFRWSYEKVPDQIAAATGIDHISIDFNPCGHPPLNVFTAPHYDFHMYRVDEQQRRCMTCDLLPGAPICNFLAPQTTLNGRGFFNVNTMLGSNQPSNMPNGFVVPASDMVPHMGGHAWDPDQQPADAMSWMEPVWTMGTYDGSVVFYEPMTPLSFVTGDEDTYFEEDLSYESQSVINLPTKYSVAYDSMTKDITVHFEGPSAVCKMREAKKSKAGKKKKSKAGKKKKSKA